MTWPADVHTTDLVFTVVRDTSGDALPSVVTITPEFGAADHLVHESGAVLSSAVERLLIRPGMERRVSVPVVDQDGWSDPTGAPFRDWSYTVTAVVGITAGRRTVVHHLQPQDGQVEVRLADVPVDDQPGTPTVGQVPAVLSVNGKTGHVVIAAGGEAPPAGIEVLFPVPVSTWTMPHNLGRRAAVALYDEHGVAMDTDVESTQTLSVVTFPQPTAGSAVLT